MRSPGHGRRCANNARPAAVPAAYLATIDRLFHLSGGHALFDTEALQRFHRDAHAVAHRDALIMDMGGQAYGKVALGLEAERGI